MTPDIRRAWLLMVAAVVFWGVNWPLMKLGLEHIGPIWFAAFRVTTGVAALVIILAVTGRLSLPKRDELPILFSVGVVQIGTCMALLHAALLYIEPGRTAVLAYTTPIWAAPMAALILSERLGFRVIAGIVLGMSGVATLFNPWAFSWTFDDVAFGSMLPLCSAVLWAGVIVHIRSHGWQRPHLSLLPWQLLVGAMTLSSIAYVVEGVPQVTVTTDLVINMAYNGIIATAFCFWAYIGAARVLPANTTALASLGIPVVGLVASALILGDPLTPTILIGLLLIGAGIMLSSSRRATKA